MISLPSHLPLLESLGLKLMGLWTSEPFSTANIPWCQLWRLDLELEHNNLPTLGDTFSILSRTCRLRQCKIDIDCTLGSGVDFHDLHLPVLEECHLILHGGNVYPFCSDSPALSWRNSSIIFQCQLFVHSLLRRWSKDPLCGPIDTFSCPSSVAFLPLSSLSTCLIFRYRKPTSSKFWCYSRKSPIFISAFR